jgi:hypothetical protein
MAAFGSFNTDVTLATGIENGIPIVAVAARDRLVVARVSTTGSVTVLTAIDAIATRSVAEIVGRTGGFDVLMIVNGAPRIMRYSADALSSEVSPLAGPATSGAAVPIASKLFTVWNVNGAVTGRFAFSTASEPLIPISQGAPNQQMPVLASDSVGVLAVWVEDVTETEDRIMARLLSRDGTPLSPEPVEVDSRTIARMTSAPAATFQGNDYYVAWVDARNGLEKSAELTLRTLDRAGQGAGTILVSRTVNPFDTPALASGGTDGLLVWTKSEPSPRLRAALFSDLQRQIEVEDLLREPAVAFGNGAYLVVGSTTSGSVRGVRLLPNGTIGATLFDTGGTVDSEPAVAFNGGDFLVAFERSGSVWVHFVNSGLELPVASSGHRPQVTWDGQAYVVAWTDGGHVHATRVLTTGIVEQQIVLSATDLNEDYPALIGLGGGSTLTAYQRMVPELFNVHRVFTRVLTPAAAPKKPAKRRSVRR